MIARGVLPAAMEMIDKLVVQAVEAAFHAGFPEDAGAVLIETHNEWAADSKRYLALHTLAGLDRLGDHQSPEVEGAKSLLLAS